MGKVALRCNGGADVLLWPEADLHPARLEMALRSAMTIVRSGCPYLRVEMGEGGGQAIRVPRWVARLYSGAPLRREEAVLTLAWRDPEMRAAMVSVLDLAGEDLGSGERGEWKALMVFLHACAPEVFVDRDDAAALGA